MKVYTTDKINENIDAASEMNHDTTRLYTESLKAWMIANGHRKQDKPFGKPYKNEYGGIFYFLDENTAFGFSKGGLWINKADCVPESLSSDFWQPYSQGNWEIMLLNYTKSRGYKNGNYKCLFQPETTGDFTGNIQFTVDSSGVWIVGEDCMNLVLDFQTGVWAEIIESKLPEYTWDEIKEKLGHEFTIKNS